MSACGSFWQNYRAIRAAMRTREGRIRLGFYLYGPAGVVVAIMGDAGCFGTTTKLMKDAVHG